MSHQDDLFALLFDKEEVTWQTMLYELVRSDQMDPWDINVSLLAQRFLDTLHQLKQMDFRVSGKIILAAAILLKIKSERLVGADMETLDRLINPVEEGEGLLDEFVDIYAGERDALKGIGLIPRTPQPRKRKVSIYDLVDALQRAMEVKKRRVMRDIPAIEMKIPEKQVEISQIIHDVYGKIKIFFLRKNASKLTFSKLIPSESKSDKIYTFIPLLHLSNQRKIDLMQYRHFGEIEIQLLQNSVEKQVDKELAQS